MLWRRESYDGILCNISNNKSNRQSLKYHKSKHQYLANKSKGFLSDYAFCSTCCTFYHNQEKSYISGAQHKVFVAYQSSPIHHLIFLYKLLLPPPATVISVWAWTILWNFAICPNEFWITGWHLWEIRKTVESLKLASQGWQCQTSWACCTVIGGDFHSSLRFFW